MPTLLVIDDNPSVRQSLRYLFQARGGYEVLTAESGAEGLTLARQHDVQAALVDVNMPGMNGVEVCRALHEQAASTHRSLSVWLMTGARTPEIARRAAEAGALAVLGKPFDFAELFQQLEEKLGGDPPKTVPPEPPAS